MPNNNGVTNSRDKYVERLKSKYPDKEFADDEALFAQTNEDYDNYDKELSDYKQREQDLSNLFASDHRSAAFLTDWRKGEDPVVSLIRKFGDEFKEALEDPEKQEALAAANKEYAERIAKEKHFEEEYQKNIQASLEMLESLQQEENLTDEDIDKAMDFLVQIMRDGLLGKFDRESVLMALKAINHDADVALADREGEVRGKNTKIVEKLRKESNNDGTANLSGKNGGSSTTRDMPDLGAISRYDDGIKNIYERGGEKRTPISRR